ncbi:MAG: ABC transporter ATP-binding protein, partial [Deltaproteobacteria bacterium]|nr:ABC transporter ATP-binding protein [Deltaproteobacteria bacterium]
MPKAEELKTLNFLGEKASSPKLEVMDIAYGYGHKNILRGLSLVFEPGLCFLAGPNGAGKSTLLSLLARLIAPKAGQIRLLGRPLDSYSALELARLLAWAPQKSIFNWPFTAREIVAMGRRP